MDNKPAIHSQTLQILSEQPEKFYGSLKVKTVDDVLVSDSPCLSKIEESLGEQKMIASLSLWLTDVVKYFNVNKSMNAEQIVQTAKLIFDSYPYMKPEDFKLCFNNAKKGTYGAVDFKIDGAVIFDWINKYLNQRLNKAEEQSIDDHNIKRRHSVIISNEHIKESEEKEREFQKIRVQEYVKGLKKDIALTISK